MADRQRDIKVSVHLDGGGRGRDWVALAHVRGDTGWQMLVAGIICWRGRHTWSPSCCSFLVLHIFPCNKADKAHVGLGLIS
jgi:hypothetical protein